MLGRQEEIISGFAPGPQPILRFFKYFASYFANYIVRIPLVTHRNVLVRTGQNLAMYSALFKKLSIAPARAAGCASTVVQNVSPAGSPDRRNKAR